jgi:hypothetical protein
VSIIKNFDMAALRKRRQNSNAKVDLVGELRKLSPEVEQLKVGETCSIDIPTKADLRKVVMSVTSKLSHLTSKTESGEKGDFVPKQFEVASDPDALKVYVQRGHNFKDNEIPTRKRGGGGGRKPKAANTAPQGASNAGTSSEAAATVAGTPEVKVADSGALVKEHA